METICCATGYGGGGLGRNLEELVESARRRGVLERYFAFSTLSGDACGEVIGRGLQPWMFHYTPLRYCPGRQTYLTGDRFDRLTARRLVRAPETLICFAGQALRSFDKARRLGCRRLELVAANSHVNNVMRQHAAAAAQWPIERSWLNEAQRRRMLREYEWADTIHVTSHYSLESFINEGVERQKLNLWPLHAHRRFSPSPERQRVRPEVFRVIYVGSITVAKGLPVLLEAFGQLKEPAAELLLIGGTSTRPMRKYIQNHMLRDKRIRLTSGDPLPWFRAGGVCVHPSYDEGFGYAPMEALQCGLWTIVTDRTGMKEHIRPGGNGDILPTGDVDALARRLGELLERWKAEQ